VKAAALSRPCAIRNTKCLWRPSGLASTVQHEWREKRRLHPEMRDAHSLRGDPNLEEKPSHRWIVTYGG
jgi:hypothetical protein